MKQPKDTRPWLTRTLWWVAGRKWNEDWHLYTYRGEICACCDSFQVEFVIDRAGFGKAFLCYPCFKHARRINPTSNAKTKQKQHAGSTAQEL